MPTSSAASSSVPSVAHVPLVLGRSTTSSSSCAPSPAAGASAARQSLSEVPVHSGTQSWYGSASPPIGEEAISKAHRKKRRAPQDFANRQLKAECLVDGEFDALVPLLPRAVVLSMLGGERGLEQVPDPVRRAHQLKRILVRRAGTDGAQIAAVRLGLGRMRAYAQEVMQVPPGAEDEALFPRGEPMSSACAHDIVAWRDESARAGARGSKGGATAAHGFGQDILFMANTLGWPIDASRVDSAAAPPKRLPSQKAGTMPLDARCHIERVASGVLPENWKSLGYSEAAKPVVVFYARSLLSGSLDHSLRLGEGMRVQLWPDEEEPARVMRGNAYSAKDGAAIDIFAPAEGLLGAYDWFPAHLAKVLELGQLYPKWASASGRGCAISKACALKEAVADDDKPWEACMFILSLPPLCYTAAEISALHLTAHSSHATPPELGRDLGAPLRLGPVSVPSALAAGFSASPGGDCDALGHWRRDPGAKAEAEASAAAMAARGADARRAAAQALSGRAGDRRAMHVYYGAPGASSNRRSERDTQLCVRQRLAHTLRLVVQHYGVDSLPRGQMSLRLLRVRTD